MPEGAQRAALSKAVDQILIALDRAGVDVPNGIRVTVETIDAVAVVPTGKASAETQAILSKRIPIFKTGEERFVLGVVLEPTLEMGKPDSQNDVYSAEEVRKSSDRFMEEFGTIGLQHQADISDRVKILRNWITHEATTINGQPVAAGTWILGVRVLDDELWAAVKSGEITGFSIGGSAKREPIK